MSLLRHVLMKNLEPVPQNETVSEILVQKRFTNLSAIMCNFHETDATMNTLELISDQEICDSKLQRNTTVPSINEESSTLTSQQICKTKAPIEHGSSKLKKSSGKVMSNSRAKRDRTRGNEEKSTFHIAAAKECNCSNDTNDEKDNLSLPVTSPDSKRQKVLSFSKKFHINCSQLRSPKLSSRSSTIRRSDIIFGDVIGKGGFGKVYAGVMDGKPVAIKVVQKRRGSGIHREILQAERLAYTMKLRHNNIVSILGINMCDRLTGDALIVMELVSPRTLQSVLDDATRDISQAQRITFALQITKALDYLHNNNVAHLDVKPRNVLMSWDDVCKLGDFGSLTRTTTNFPREDVEFTQILGTLPYRAPELMQGCFPSTKADVYSLGITLWQLATREAPHSGTNPHTLIYQVIRVNKRPDYHDTGSDATEVKYRELYTSCWDADPDSRPPLKDVTNILNELMDSCWEESWGEDEECLRVE